MFTEHERRSPEGVTREDYDANKVEKDERRNALDNLQEKLKKSRDPKPTLKDKLPSFFKGGRTIRMLHRVVLRIMPIKSPRKAETKIFRTRWTGDKRQEEAGSRQKDGVGQRDEKCPS